MFLRLYPAAEEVIFYAQLGEEALEQEVLLEVQEPAKLAVILLELVVLGPPLLLVAELVTLRVAVVTQQLLII